MKQDRFAAVADALRTVPDGMLEETRCVGGAETGRPRLRPMGPGQKGRRELFTVCPGIRFACVCYAAGMPPESPEEGAAVIACCRSGALHWKRPEAAPVCLDAGAMALWRQEDFAAGETALPLGYYEGYTLDIDITALAAHPPDALQCAGWDGAILHKLLDGEDRPVLFEGSAALEQILAPLEGLPQALRSPYYLLKAQELLLSLDALPRGAGCSRQLQQAARMREIHDLLTRDLTRRVTIEELSRRFLINTSSLKAMFKAVYGQPIAAYMKTYRVQKAMERLRNTDDSIADIAADVGYETQGKFTKAFKDVAGMLPSEYRKRHR